MPDPFRLRAVKAVTDAFKQITPADGYVSDLSDFTGPDGVTTSRVYRGVSWFGESHPMPMVSVLEPDSPGDLLGETAPDNTGALYDWPLLIQGFVRDDPDNPTDPAYVLVADVRQRLMVEKVRKHPDKPARLDPFGLGSGANRIDSLTVGSPFVRPAGDVSPNAWFYFILTLRIVEDVSDPYG